MVVQCYSLSLDPSLSLSVFLCSCMSLWHFALHCNSEVFAGWCRLCKLRAVFHCQRGEGSPLQSVWRWIRPSCLPAFQSPVQPHVMNTMTQRCMALFITWSNGPSHILMELFRFLLKGYWPLCLRSSIQEDLSLPELLCAAGSLAWTNSSKVQNQFMVWMCFRPTTGRNHSHAFGRLAVPIQ